MQEKLYIPQEIRVGFQKREDTFTKKLAYIIYVDGKGVLRKETSWEGWRDKKIPSESYENVPTSGFMINRNVERYNWGHFSNNRSYIRIHDPRGFEFEITPENLIGILMSGDCNRRLLDGEFVYSWHGTNLVLLPVASEVYKECQTFTSLQVLKLSAKSLVPGLTYRTKQMVDYIYLGKFDWTERTYWTAKKTAKKFIFARKANTAYEKTKSGWVFEGMNSLSSFATVVTDISASNFAELAQELSERPEVAKISKVSLGSKVDILQKKKQYSYFNQDVGFVQDKQGILAVHVNGRQNWPNGWKQNETPVESFDVTFTLVKHNSDIVQYATITTKSRSSYDTYTYETPNVVKTQSFNSMEQLIRDLDIKELQVEMTNGTILRADAINELWTLPWERYDYAQAAKDEADDEDAEADLEDEDTN